MIRPTLAAIVLALVASAVAIALSHPAASSAPAVPTPAVSSQPWQELADRRDHVVMASREICAQLDAGAARDAVLAQLAETRGDVAANALYAYATGEYCPQHVSRHI